MEHILNKKRKRDTGFPPILPLFWQRGEKESVIRNEIRQMHEKGIKGFIAESRPHPDFLGPGWWKDVDIMLDEARQRKMRVWFFDDLIFPSGFAAGRIRKLHPEYLKVYLKETHVDAAGPRKNTSFIAKGWLNRKGEELVRVVAAKRIDMGDSIEPDTLTDLTSRITDGILYWDIPEGFWRVFFFVCMRDGGEIRTKDYLNPLVPEATDAFIRFVYEEFYRRYPEEFGKTIGGFFSDEPRFGNAGTYDAVIGRFPMVLPYSATLLDELSEEWNGDFGRLLPVLWYDAGSLSSHARYAFMNVVSRLYGQNFTSRIGNWCRKHRVKLIGHVVEDKGAHSRLGYGAGHFFRAIEGQDSSGYDIVYQIWPEYTSGWLTTTFGHLDNDFFYWGMGKMASSAGHIDPKKKGMTICELFGAYGWQEGLKLMKWLTDHACVRGANVLVPHAFSPKFPDRDCPPHFYAQGANPQWRYFHIWSGYAQKVCGLLSGGTHVAPAAVVYHAEAEWAGSCVPFEKVVRPLAAHQIDCDVIPIDAFMSKDLCSFSEGRITVNKENYQAVIIPYAQHLPEEFITRLVQIADAGVRIVFTQDFPEESCARQRHFKESLEMLKKHPLCSVCREDGLPQLLRKHGIYDIEISHEVEHLRYYHYSHPDSEIYFFVNESTLHDVHTAVRFGTSRKPLAYDAMEDRIYRIPHTLSENHVSADIHLEPYQSLFIIFSGKQDVCTRPLSEWRKEEFSHEVPVTGPWKVSKASARQYPRFVKIPAVSGPGNVAVPELLPGFSGMLRYEACFEIKKKKEVRGMRLDIGEAYEIAEVILNGKRAGVKICPPYVFDITGLICEGKNSLVIEVTNTLAKKLGENVFDRCMPQEPSGLIGPVRLFLSERTVQEKTVRAEPL